jgi:hypothetical protein
MSYELRLEFRLQTPKDGSGTTSSASVSSQQSTGTVREIFSLAVSSVFITPSLTNIAITDDDSQANTDDAYDRQANSSDR